MYRRWVVAPHNDCACACTVHVLYTRFMCMYEARVRQSMAEGRSSGGVAEQACNWAPERQLVCVSSWPSRAVYRLASLKNMGTACGVVCGEWVDTPWTEPFLSQLSLSYPHLSHLPSYLPSLPKPTKATCTVTDPAPCVCDKSVCIASHVPPHAHMLCTHTHTPTQIGRAHV